MVKMQGSYFIHRQDVVRVIYAAAVAFRILPVRSLLHVDASCS